MKSPIQLLLLLTVLLPSDAPYDQVLINHLRVGWGWGGMGNVVIRRVSFLALFDMMSRESMGSGINVEYSQRHVKPIIYHDASSSGGSILTMI